MRGEIWTAAGGQDYAGKPRPVVVVQDDIFRDLASVTVCGFTTHGLDAPMIRLPVEPNDANGLREPSWIMVDKVTTVSRAKLRDRLGVLHESEMTRLNGALAVFLGLASSG